MLKKVDIAIVGNGIVALAIAEQLRDSNLAVAVIGPVKRADSASLAAAAMLNSFAELNENSLEREIQKYKFSKSRLAAEAWPSYLKRLESQSGIKINTIKTTSLLKTDSGSDRHFNAVHAYLKEFKEEFQLEAKRLSILNEHALEPFKVIQSLEVILSSSVNITFFDDSVVELETGKDSRVLTLKSGKVLQAQKVLLASGSQIAEFRKSIPALKGMLQIFHGRGVGAHLSLPNHGLEGTQRTCHNGAHCGVYLIPYDKDRLYLGATSDLLDVKEKRDQRVEINYLLERAIEFLNPEIRNANIEKVVLGHRPTTADAFPIMGETTLKNVFVASGTKRDGFHMAPIIASEMSNCILNNTLAFEGKFNPERKLIFCSDEAKMLEDAKAYFKLKEETIFNKWAKIKLNYPMLKSGIETELWPLFENKWVDDKSLS